MDITERIAALAVKRMRPDGSDYHSLAEADGITIAAESGLPLSQVQAKALDACVIPERYARNFSHLDYAGQARLLRSAVALVGLGGLGGNVLEVLVRMGVGTIAAADGDAFEESNLNRQLLSSLGGVDVPKSQAARERVRDLNPAVDFTAGDDFADYGEMLEMARSADVVVDALGGLDDRPALQQACSEAGVPLVTAAIAGSSGYVATVLPGASGPADLIGTGSAAEDALGSPAPAVHTAATLQAAEVVRMLSGREPNLDGRMLLFDLEDMTFDTVTL